MSNDSRLHTTASFLCSCCWPSRKNHEAADDKRPDLYEVAIFKQFTSTNEQTAEIVRPPHVNPLHLSPERLPRIVVTSTSSSQLTTSTEDDYESLVEFVTARTSRPDDERRFRSMPELVCEIRSELLGTNFEDMKQEFLTFFRGAPEKPPLLSAPPPVAINQAPYPSNPPVDPKLPIMAALSTQMSTPLRPLVSQLQLSSARMSEHAHNTVYFFYWCLAFGFQKLLGETSIDEEDS